MLELDLFLMPFFEHRYASLTEREKELFCTLLAQSDPDLFSWLMAFETPQDKGWAELVEKIRAFRLL